MKTIFVCRHQGAIEWMKKQDIHIDFWTDSLNIEDVSNGDIVIGILPIHLAAAVCAKGAKFLALRIDLPKSFRGQELTKDDLDKLNCSIVAYKVIID